MFDRFSTVHFICFFVQSLLWSAWASSSGNNDMTQHKEYLSFIGNLELCRFQHNKGYIETIWVIPVAVASIHFVLSWTIYIPLSPIYLCVIFATFVQNKNTKENLRRDAGNPYILWKHVIFAYFAPSCHGNHHDCF